MDPKLPLHAVAIFCLAAIFLAFHWGYSKKKRDEMKEQKRIWEREKKRLPRAVK